MYALGMDVAISALRADLSNYVAAARAGEEVVITDRGTPVARLAALSTEPLLARLISSGVLTKPKMESRPSARSARRAKSVGPESVSDLVSEQRG